MRHCVTIGLRVKGTLKVERGNEDKEETGSIVPLSVSKTENEEIS